MADTRGSGYFCSSSQSWAPTHEQKSFTQSSLHCCTVSCVLRTKWRLTRKEGRELGKIHSGTAPQARGALGCQKGGPREGPWSGQWVQGGTVQTPQLKLRQAQSSFLTS